MAVDTIKIQDRILLSRAINEKDREALGRLHSSYYLRIKHYITSRINSISDIEDLSQNVFLELCKGNGHYDGQRDAKAYLFGIARNVIGRYHRNRRKHPQAAQIDSVGDIVISCNVQQHGHISLKQLRELFKDATEQLPPKAKDAAIARLIEGLTPKEAAEKCDCSRDAFYKRFNATLKALDVMRETGSLSADDTSSY